MEVLKGYAWPGNVRELKNVVQRAMITSSGPGLAVDATALQGATSFRAMTLDEVQRRHILEVLERTGWRVSGSGGAAEVLDVKPTTLDTG